MNQVFAGVPSVALIIVGLVAIAVTGFLSAVEVAVSRLSRAFVADLVEEERPGASRLVALVEHPGRTSLALRGARVSLQTVAIVSVTVGTVALLSRAEWPWWLTTLVCVLGIGAVEFVVVSLLPWLWVGSNYVAVAIAGSRFTGFLVRISHFFDPLLRVTSKRLPKASDNAETQRLSIAEDLREIADEAGEPENIEAEDKEMLKSVFELGQTLIREVMVPRTSMVTVGAETPLDEALVLFSRSGFSRMPMVGDDIDDVVGIVYLKDIIHRLINSAESQDQPVRHVARPAVFIPEMVAADDELRAMQKENTHFAIVVDEYGGIAGLVTIEDILEELVGELTDEHDRFEMEPELIGEGVWRVPARFPLKDLEELLDIEIDEEHVDSVGGLLATAIGAVPLPGVCGEIAGLDLQADEAVGRRRQIVSVVVKKEKGHNEDNESGPGEADAEE